jgi:preprotein translocase subunit SecG
MKIFIRPFAFLIIILLLALIGSAFARSISIQSNKTSSHKGIMMFFQIATTPQPKADRSEIGSTDNITMLSFVIVATIVIPILMQRKHWLQT